MRAVTIIGGGLAGLTLGIGLRQRGVPVTIIEAGDYPRHRVCGEFISGAGLEALRSSGLMEVVPPALWREARSAAFYSEQTRLGARTLPAPAGCVSRFVFDAALRTRFCESGGELRLNQRWNGSAEPGVVLASGRRAQPTEDGWRWFGLKVHARHITMDADLEMHLSRNAYVGLCRLAGGEVNVCGLFRRRVQEAGRGASLDWLRGSPESPLFARLAKAELDQDSFCAVAGLSLRPQPIEPGWCRIGDALTMIPPITGNGMSMALESAALALDPLTEYAVGAGDWGSASAKIADQLRERFRRRLRWASWFQKALFSPLAVPALKGTMLSARGWQFAFAATR